MTENSSEKSGQLPLFEFDAENLNKVKEHRPFPPPRDTDLGKYIVYVMKAAIIV